MKFELVEAFAKKKDLKIIPDKDLFGLKLYFISKGKSHKTLSPKIPKTVAGNDMENPDIKRVCFAPSIDQCLKAIGKPKTDYYVYIPKGSLAGHKFYKCSTHEVMDAYSTDEYWCLDDIEVQLVGKIHTQNQLILLGDERYGWGFKYSVKQVLGDNIDYYNILEDYALCNHIKFKEARANKMLAELEFKSEAEAKEFYNKAKKDLNESRLSYEDTIVYYASLDA